MDWLNILSDSQKETLVKVAGGTGSITSMDSTIETVVGAALAVMVVIATLGPRLSLCCIQ